MISSAILIQDRKSLEVQERQYHQPKSEQIGTGIAQKYKAQMSG
jgi:hypothetical protein